jgi:hypothetical protein
MYGYVSGADNAPAGELSLGGNEDFEQLKSQYPRAQGSPVLRCRSGYGLILSPQRLGHAHRIKGLAGWDGLKQWLLACDA